MSDNGDGRYVVYRVTTLTHFKHRYRSPKFFKASSRVQPNIHQRLSTDLR